MRRNPRGEGHAHGADDLAAARGDNLRGSFLKLRAEGIVGCQKEPGLFRPVSIWSWLFRCQSGRVIGVMNRVRRAIFAGERSARCTDREKGGFFSFAISAMERLRRIGATKHHRHAIAIGPFAEICRTEVWLVLMVSGDELDLVAKDSARCHQHCRAR